MRSKSFIHMDSDESLDREKIRFNMADDVYIYIYTYIIHTYIHTYIYIYVMNIHVLWIVNGSSEGTR